MPLLTFPWPQILSAGGSTYPGAKLFFYETGTSTLATTYTDAALTTPHTNPVIADATGVFPPIYLANKRYKAVLKTAGDVTLFSADPAHEPATPSVATIAAMTAIDSPTNGMTVQVSDLDRGGYFVFDTTATSAADNGITFKSDDATSGSWVRQYSGSVNVRWFGAVGDSATNDTAAIQAAIDYALTVGGEVFLPAGYYRVTASLNIGLPFYIDDNDVSFIVERTDIIDDPADIAKQNATNKAANVSKKRIDFVGEAETYIVADFAPSVYTPVVAYNLDNDSFDNTGKLANFAVVAANQVSGGAFVPYSTYVENKLVGVYAGRGCGISEKLFFAGLGVGYMSHRGYWMRQSDMKANRCGLGFCLSAHNQSKASELNTHTCLTGYSYDGQAGLLQNFGTENCNTDIEILRADCCTFGPAYLEDVRDTGLAGTYAVKLGRSQDGTEVVHCVFNNILVLINGDSSKKGYRFWSVGLSTFIGCRSYSSGYDIDNLSHGRLIQCDFTVGNTAWRGDFPSLLVDDTEQANGAIGTFHGTGITETFDGVGNAAINTVPIDAGRGGGMCIIRGADYTTGESFCFIYPVRIQISGGADGVSAGTPMTVGGSGLSFAFGSAAGLLTITASGFASSGEWYASFFGM